MANEYIKISLHNHFGGKGWQRVLNKTESLTNFDLNFAKRHIDNAKSNGFEMLGFTNHNVFSFQHYSNTRAYAESVGIKLLPGCEFDYVSDVPESKKPTKTLHTVVIFDPDSNLSLIESKIENCMIANGCNCINTEQLVEILVVGKCVVIPHGARKQGSSKRNATNNVEQFKEILAMRNFIPIFLEDSKPFHKRILVEKLKEELSEDAYEYLDSNIPSVSAADENDFDKISIPTYLWGDNSFNSLFYASLLGNKRILSESDISNKIKYIKKMIIENQGGPLQNSTLLFSHGLNTIIGNSGSGKTLLLNLINKKITGNNLISSVSSNNCNYDDMYKDAKVTLFDNSDSEISLGDINVFEGENLYKQILSTLKSDKNSLLLLMNAVPNFDSFDKTINDFNNSASLFIKNGEKVSLNTKTIQEEIKLLIASVEYLISNSVDQNYIDYTKNEKIISNLEKENELLTKHQTNLSDAVKSSDTLINIAKEYSIVFDDSIGLAIEQLKKAIKVEMAKNTMEISKQETFSSIQNKMYELANDYNSLIGNKFKNFMSSKQNIQTSTERIIQKIKENILIEQENLCPVLNREILLNSFSVSNSDIKLSNKSIRLEITYDDITKVFEPSIGSAGNKTNKSLFKEVFENGKNINLTNFHDVSKLLNVFIKNGAQPYSLINFNKQELLEYSIQLKTQSGEYKNIMAFSAGELSKIYIDNLINEKLSKLGTNAIIVYDQPDNNLEKKFILDTLCTKLCELKKTYQIFITTHEPLLVVSADSNAIIHAKNEKMVGGLNKITFENKSFISSTSEQQAVKEIAEVIDGSPDAVKLRNKIYGGMKDA